MNSICKLVSCNCFRVLLFKGGRGGEQVKACSTYRVQLNLKRERTHRYTNGIYLYQAYLFKRRNSNFCCFLKHSLGISSLCLGPFFSCMLLRNQYSKIFMWVIYFNIHLFLSYSEGKEHCHLITPKVLSNKIMKLFIKPFVEKKQLLVWFSWNCHKI